jgi:hypothetical protein
MLPFAAVVVIAVAVIVGVEVSGRGKSPASNAMLTPAARSWPPRQVSP